MALVFDCGSCGVVKLAYEGARIQSKPGGLFLCRQCLDEINANNPELHEAKDRIAELEAACSGFPHLAPGSVRKLVEACKRLANAVDSYLADQDDVIDNRLGNVQPVTLAEAVELNNAYVSARAALALVRPHTTEGT